MITLVLGGARSGKSRYAEELALSRPPPRLYLATAEAHDAEMAERIREHRQRRAGHWTTLEEPLALAEALRRQGADPATTLLVDCLTLWLANLIGAGRDVGAASAELIAACAAVRGEVILVSTEVGLGIVPDNALARAFRDHAGRLHQAVAAQADRVVFVAAGLPLTLKAPVEPLSNPA
ncbi:MAG: bifunctional adenosylcobinamide kinase/adenosylcobinamide-phosphate guanylyltransferase [Rhodospirillaceae bacterium]